MAGYTAIFAGLGSAYNPRYTKGTKAIAARVAGSTHYASGSGYADWPAVAREIVSLHKAGNLPRPVSLVGHSNGVYAILKIAEFLAVKNINIDYIAAIDQTLKPCPDAGANIRLLHDFWAGLSKVDFNGFTGKKKFFDLDGKGDEIGDGVGHVEAATLPFTQDKIVETIAFLTEGGEPVQYLFYIGEGRKLSDDDFAAISAGHEIPEYLLRAVTEIEARQKGSHSSGALMFRYELHKAFQYSSGAVRDRLVAAGLANSSYNIAKNWKHANSYPHLEKAAEIAGEELACLASSWGMGQIMGFNHRVCGFETALDMVQNFAQSEANQINGMVAFIKGNGLLDDLLCERWKAFAAGYNGNQYAANRYEVKLSDAASRWKAQIGSGVAVIPTDPEPMEPPTPPAIKDLGSLDNARALMEQFFPKLNEQSREMVLALAMILGRMPPGVTPAEITTNPVTEPGFSLPKLNVKGNTMKGIKGFFQSKTIRGAVAALFGSVLPSVAPFFGFDFSAGDGQAVMENVSRLVEVLGSLYAIYGRVVAKDQIRLGG